MSNIFTSLRILNYSQIAGLVNPHDQTVQRIAHYLNLSPRYSQIENVNAIYNFVTNTVKYKSDDNGDNWQTPSLTIQRGLGDCFTGDTQIIAIDKNGYYCTPSFKELEKNYKNYKNYSALSYNFMFSQWEFQPITNFWDKGEKEIVSTHLQNGNDIFCTPDHKIATSRKLKKTNINFEPLSKISNLIKNGSSKQLCPIVARKIPALKKPINYEKELLWVPIWRLYEFPNSTYNQPIKNYKSFARCGLSEIENAGMERVYDIEVANNHNFVLANSGLLVHNCEDLSILCASLYSVSGINSFFVYTSGVRWREDHVSNMVMVTDNSYTNQYIYLDASYPHKLGALPFYINEAYVFGETYINFPRISPFTLFLNEPLQNYVNSMNKRNE